MSIIVFKKKFLQEVEDKSNYLSEKLQAVLPQDQFRVRGSGLLLGIECKGEVQPFIQQAEEADYCSSKQDRNVIRLLPPLTVTYEEIDEAMEIISSILLAEKVTVNSILELRCSVKHYSIDLV